MKLQDLLDKIKDEKPNSFGDERLIAFVNEIERDVAEQLHTLDDFVPYTNTDEDKARSLIAPAPYDRLYISYVKGMIDFANEEYPSYQLNQNQFNIDFADYIDWVVRTAQVQAQTMPARIRNIF